MRRILPVHAPHARFALLPVALVALLGCDPPKSSGGAGSALPSATPPASAAEVAAQNAGPAPPPPENLNVAELQKALKCALDAKSGPCGVLAKFSACSGWTGVSPSGDGRWFGHGYVIEGSKTSDQIALVRSRRVPTSEVAPGQIGAKISVTELPKSEGLPFDHADRTIRIFERQDVPAKANPTIDYVKKRSDWPEAYATRTVGGQVYVIAQPGTYLCQGSKQQLFMVQRASTKAGSGDGIYAELWGATW